MEAFISYSHKDEGYLDLFHRHLAQLKRDGLIGTWTDQKILAGGRIDDEVSTSLNSAQIFIAMLSPDYINSNYCYEREFQTAMEMQAKNMLTIVPIVLEPCDWKSTPFSKYKALPKDGKPVSEWSNKNNAMLDVVQNLRLLVSGEETSTIQQKSKKTVQLPTNYKVKKDFDSLQKMDFQDEGFKKLKSILENNIEEINQIENIKARVLTSTDNTFEALIVNRNRVQSESKITINKGKDQSLPLMTSGSFDQSMTCKFDNGTSQNLAYAVSHDDFDLFWIGPLGYYFGKEQTRLSMDQICNEIWTNWLEKVGIVS
ncbi:TIR domain-containing protein [Flagellimonas taeanensis]|uniref:TIR domain-containing protein n=1 Tax=Flagellimonas taeanensis TaxID=1005926 RepID=A0A1M7CUQ1_9FLAO|nr:toll/interleukin-1 receptor domain-containing protein [Allomuricauda taeanensis]SFC65958.1 TIR domain-containing protein [Allomuricauda taeanensis]SHL70966.1 TIR domain-containing protein [Allomuricauda taeanensis]